MANARLRVGFVVVGSLSLLSLAHGTGRAEAQEPQVGSTPAADKAGLPKMSYKLYIAPIIFGLAPVVNTLISSFWHPSQKDGWANFHFEMPNPLLIVGIVFVGLGAALVLYSKELTESKAAKPTPVPVLETPTTAP